MTSAEMVRPVALVCSGPSGCTPRSSSGMWPKRVCSDSTTRGTRSRCDGSMTVVAQSGSRPTSERTLSRDGTAVRQAQHVVVEAILLVPHPIVTDLVQGGANPQEVLGELEDEIVVAGVVRRQLDRDLEHVLAEHRHPRGAVGLFEMAAGRQLGAAIEHADVVETEEPALEHALPQTVLAIDPPREVDHELAERALQELDVALRRASPARCGIERASPRHAPAG